MHDDGARTGRVGELHSPDKGKKPCGVVWDSMVRPAGEVELFHFPDLVVAPLCKHVKKCFFQKSPNKAIRHQSQALDLADNEKKPKTKNQHTEECIKDHAFSEKGCWPDTVEELSFIVRCLPKEDN